MPDGIFDTNEFISSIVVLLDQIEVKGVKNMGLIIEAIKRLDALKKGLENEKNQI